MPPKTQAEMLSEVYDELIGSPDKVGLGEELRALLVWKKQHEAKHACVERWFWRLVSGTIGSAAVSLLGLAIWWVKNYA